MNAVMAGKNCPLCGYDYAGWTLIGQMAHLSVDHSWWERLRLRRRVRLPLREFLVYRKYGVKS